VTPDEAMKKVVWSQTRVEGGEPFTGVLKQPPAVAGLFQNAPGLAGFGGMPAPKTPDFYKDIAVLAVPTRGDLTMAELKTKVSANGAEVDPSAIFDRDFTTSLKLASSPDKPTALDIDFGTAQTIRGVSLGVSNSGDMMAMFMNTTDGGPELLASDDGRQYRSPTPSGAGCLNTR
jgi:hypothetical protein